MIFWRKSLLNALMQIFIMLRHLFAEISRFKFDDYRVIRAGGSDLKLFFGRCISSELLISRPAMRFQNIFNHEEQKFLFGVLSMIMAPRFNHQVNYQNLVSCKIICEAHLYTYYTFPHNMQ